MGLAPDSTWLRGEVTGVTCRHEPGRAPETQRGGDVNSMGSGDEVTHLGILAPEENSEMQKEDGQKTTQS